MLSREKLFFDWNENFRARIRISRIERRRKFETINSRICSKNCSNWICSASCFREKNRLLTEIKPSELQKTGISRIVWARKVDTFHSRNLFKNCSDRLFNASCLRKKSHFLTEFKPLESGISRIAWRRKFERINSRNYFKTTSNTLCIAPCFRKRSHFLTEFKPLQFEPGNSRNAWRRKFERISSRNYFKSTSNRLCTAPYFRERSHFWLKANLQSSIFFSI